MSRVIIENADKLIYDRVRDYLHTAYQNEDSTYTLTIEADTIQATAYELPIPGAPAEFKSKHINFMLQKVGKPMLGVDIDCNLFWKMIFE